MLEKFWDGVGEQLADQWNARFLTLAFAFWGCGLVLFGARNGWDSIQQVFLAIGPQPILSGALIIGLLAVTVVSDTVISWLAPSLLKLLEGYWPDWVRDRLTIFELRRRNRLKDLYNQLLMRVKTSAAPAEITAERRLARLEFDLRFQFPSESALLPTAPGNILRAAEEYSWTAYGLEAIITWPHLWMMIPEQNRQVVNNARQRLDNSVRLLLWCLLFCVWSFLYWWIPIACLLAAVLIWKKITADAGAFGLLIRTAYDLYRFDLYKSLHWPVPISSETCAEVEHGRALTEHLYRHTTIKAYIHP